ncbi:filamentous hemagglutinin N-terminal domain-containing protein [Sphaerothrix gracilis]|uniref:two-partner secretion domain-containing protein n=1 Tax=Sphaerothrix gracilis TaxID=3151835 RepID=UPI0031FC9FF3
MIWTRQFSYFTGKLAATLSFSLMFQAISLPVRAQIIPDLSLDDSLTPVIEESVVNQVDGSDLNLRITDGVAQGANLFHSFQEFHVNENQSVYFANPADVENIVSRVTGSNGSNIDGLLGVDGSANLFFVNPNGIVCGPDAQLDISGSFVATTGDGFLFDNEIFSATNPGLAPLVAVSVTPGIQIGPDAPAMLIDGATLSVGGDLQLAAGSITFQTYRNLALENSMLLATSGKLVLEASEDIRILDSTLSSEVSSSGITFSGTTFIKGDSVFIESSNVNSVNNIADSNSNLLNNPGLIQITATNEVSISESQITASAFDSNSVAGIVTISGNNSVSIDNSLITSNDSLIDSPDDSLADSLSQINILSIQGSVVLDRTDIEANDSGNVLAGLIRISGQNYIGVNDTNISAAGGSGEILLGNSETRQSSDLTVGPGAFWIFLVENAEQIQTVLLAPTPQNISIDRSILTTTNRLDSPPPPDEAFEQTNRIRPPQFFSGGAVSIEAQGNITVIDSRIRNNVVGILEREALTRLSGEVVYLNNSEVLSVSEVRCFENISCRDNPNGDISLNVVDLLLMQGDSLISARAFEDANGGNVFIDAGQGFVVGGRPGVNGNDIIASAEGGDGGFIQINAAGIFGFRIQPAVPGNRTNDIDASSEFGSSGIISTTNLGLDPTRDAVDLPVIFVDTSQLVGRSCQTALMTEEHVSRLFVTGRGGLPPDATVPLSPVLEESDWIVVESVVNAESSAVPLHLSVSDRPPSPLSAACYLLVSESP